jgi:UvrD/REP helicase N-terminal domain
MSWDTGLQGTPLNIAAYPGAQLRVVAGPGTGKTYALMRRVARLLEQNVQPKRILAVTFTRTAASDLVDKLGDLGVAGADQHLSHAVELRCLLTFVLRSGRTSRSVCTLGWYKGHVSDEHCEQNAPQRCTCHARAFSRLRLGSQTAGSAEPKVGLGSVPRRPELVGSESALRSCRKVAGGCS